MEDLEKRIEELRNSYTFDQDKKSMDDLQKKVRLANVKSKALDVDGVKMMVDELSKIISDLSVMLSWDKEMTEEKRKIIFAQRECYLWVYSFFKDPEEIIESAIKLVKSEF